MIQLGEFNDNILRISYIFSLGLCYEIKRHADNQAKQRYMYLQRYDNETTQYQNVG